MKLIDVEKLEKYKADCCVSLTEWQEGWNDAIDTIMNETPTVEAIPVEYIEAFKREVRNVANGKAVIDWLLEELPLVIDEIVRIWEKENDFTTNSRMGNRSNGDNDSNISSTTNSGLYKESITR